MIDIHLHILPGLDDGPGSMEEAIDLARVLVQEGIHTAIATPHYNDEFPQRSVAEVKELVSEMQQVLDYQGISLRLFAGHEALIKPGLLNDIQSAKLATLNGSRYLLLELWNDILLPYIEQVVFELRASGITPILAHPERHYVFQRELKRLTPLLRQGVLVQITASSLVGMQGRVAQHTAEVLLKQGLVHCIASDAHGLQKRPPALAQSLRQLTQIVGQIKTRQLTEDVPLMIVNNIPYQMQK